MKKLPLDYKHPCPDFSTVTRDIYGKETRFVPVIVNSYDGEIPGQAKLNEYDEIDDFYSFFLIW